MSPLLAQSRHHYRAEQCPLLGVKRTSGVLSQMSAYIAGCCACAATGHATADPAVNLMKSRRRIAFTKAGTTPNRTDYSRDLRPAEWGPNVILRSNNPQDRMSALGHKRTFGSRHLMSQKRTLFSTIVMSALCQKRDSCTAPIRRHRERAIRNMGGLVLT